MAKYTYSLHNILQSEIQRNHAGDEIFTRFLQRAFHNPSLEVFISHHIGYVLFEEGKEKHPVEIPSADTLLFSRELMGKVFGDQAMPIMRALLMCEPDCREEHLLRELEALEAWEALETAREHMRHPMALTQTVGVFTLKDENEHRADKI